MERRSYHHGNLREAVLERAMEVVRERGVEGLALREIARDIGVSHGAPQRHFADRQALLDAVAQIGFERLGDELRRAAARADDDFQARVEACSRAYVTFATRDAALLDLMFASKHREDSGPLHDAVQGAVAVMLDLIEQGRHSGIVESDDDAEYMGIVMLATIHGIATLVNADLLAPELAGDLVAVAIKRFLRGSR